MTVQAFTLGPVITPALVSFFAPAAVAAAAKDSVRWELAAAPLKPNFFIPSAETMGDWVVRAMGKGVCPVLSPHPGHALSAAAREPLLSLTWPGCMRRAVARRLGSAMGGGRKDE